MPKEVKKQNDKQNEDLMFFLKRKNQLIEARKNSGIEKIWQQADADYVPHELGLKKKVLVENERTEVSSYVNLSRDEWRSKMASNDPYIKIQTALSILVDRNPQAVFDPISKRFEANTKLLEQLYHRSWSNTKIGSKQQLRKYIFNLGKYGWSPARRYYKRVERKGMNAIEKFDLVTQEFVYKKKDMVDVDDVFFEAKSPFDVWIDDMAKPDEPLSRRDWMWQEVFDQITLTNLFGDEVVKKIKFSGHVIKNEDRKTSQQYESDDLTKIWFYENRLTDKMMIVSDNDELIKAMPIPREDKELSLVDTIWTLRDVNDPYGIGLNEIMRNNKVTLDKVRNMTIDQVVLSIYKMFFFSNSEQLDDEGGETISIEPGKGKKVIDPKNITWFDVPGPGQDAFRMTEMLEKNLEDDTGVTKTLEGEITGKTAFEISLAQQGALRRLKTPLENIKSALEWDAKLCVNLMQMVYSVPRVFSFTEPELITEYIVSIEDDKDRYFVDGKGVFNALKYREFQLNLEQNEDGVFEGAEEKKFFMVKPSYLDWEGEIVIRVESMLEQSRPLERQAKLELSNILLPLIGQMAANPVFQQVYIKPVKQLLKQYDEDPKDWLPVEWLQGNVALNGQFPVAVDPNQQTIQSQVSPQLPSPQNVVPSATLPSAQSEAGLIQSAV